MKRRKKQRVGYKKENLEAWRNEKEALQQERWDREDEEGLKQSTKEVAMMKKWFQKDDFQTGDSTLDIVRKGRKEAKMEEEMHQKMRDEGGESWWSGFSNEMLGENGLNEEAIQSIQKIEKGEYLKPRVIVTQDKQALYSLKDPRTGNWEVVKHADYVEGRKPKWQNGDGGMKIIGNFAKGLVKIAIAGAITYGVYTYWGAISSAMSSFSLVKDIANTVNNILGFDLFGQKQSSFLGGGKAPENLRDEALRNMIEAPPPYDLIGPQFPPIHLPIEKYNMLSEKEKIKFLADPNKQDEMTKYLLSVAPDDNAAVGELKGGVKRYFHEEGKRLLGETGEHMRTTNILRMKQGKEPVDRYYTAQEMRIMEENQKIIDFNKGGGPRTMFAATDFFGKALTTGGMAMAGTGFGAAASPIPIAAGGTVLSGNELLKSFYGYDEMANKKPIPIMSNIRGRKGQNIFTFSEVS